jgi:hypothetical protein
MYYGLSNTEMAEPLGPSMAAPVNQPMPQAQGTSLTTPFAPPLQAASPVIGGTDTGKKKKKKKGPKEFAVPVPQRPAKAFILAGAVLGVIMAGTLAYKLITGFRKAPAK